jgi:hypothetical protein
LDSNRLLKNLIIFIFFAKDSNKYYHTKSSNKTERTRLTSLNIENTSVSYSNPFSLYQQYNNFNSYSNTGFNVQHYQYAPSNITNAMTSNQYFQKNSQSQSQLSANFVANKIEPANERDTGENFGSGISNGENHANFLSNTASNFK